MNTGLPGKQTNVFAKKIKKIRKTNKKSERREKIQNEQAAWMPALFEKKAKKRKRKKK